MHSVRTLILEDYPDQNVKFLKENDITLFQFGIAGNKVKHDGRERENACCFGHMWSRVGMKKERALANNLFCSCLLNHLTQISWTYYDG